jgi:hypothetical protein
MGESMNRFFVLFFVLSYSIQTSAAAGKEKSDQNIKSDTASGAPAQVPVAGTLGALQPAKQAQEKDDLPVFYYPNQFQAARQAALKKLTNSFLRKVAKKYIAELEHKEANLWKRFFAITKLSKSDVHAMIKKHEKEYVEFNDNQMQTIMANNQPQKVPASLVQTVNRIREEYFDIKTKIQVVSDPYALHLFWVGRAAIYVNSESLHFFDPTLYPDTKIIFKNGQLDALLVHEMWHILFQDRYLEWLAQNVFTQYVKEQDKSDYQDLMRDFHLFVEYRCDILTGISDLGSVTRLQGLVSVLSKVNTDDDPMHPQVADRAAYLKKLHEDMIADLETDTE